MTPWLTVLTAALELAVKAIDLKKTHDAKEAAEIQAAINAVAGKTPPPPVE
ncbi:MAG: hypothetical protein WCN81_16530 [Actinomycetes bacterium]